MRQVQEYNESRGRWKMKKTRRKAGIMATKSCKSREAVDRGHRDEQVQATQHQTNRRLKLEDDIHACFLQIDMTTHHRQQSSINICPSSQE